MAHFGRSEFQAAADAIRGKTQQQPRIGMILGSGLGDLAKTVQNADVIPYNQIPNWPVSTVHGHAGELYLGTFEGHAVMMMRGRSHFYEGYPLTQITLPVRVMQLLGVEILIVTNAAGGINPAYTPGELMLITDHINMVGMAGNNPLMGPNDDSLGPRFPGMTQVYDANLRRLARDAADEQNVPLHEGIYVGLAGPSFETPAEIRFLRGIGGDAVGMSTVHEALVARHAPNEEQRVRVLGVSGITNVAIDDPNSTAEADHEEVLETGRVLVPRLEAVIRGVLRKLPTNA